MFIVLAHTAKYLEPRAAGDAAAPQYRVVAEFYETEAEARASYRYDPERDDDRAWRDVAYMFETLNGSPGGNLAIYAGDNGWSLVNSAPRVVVGFFATVDEIPQVLRRPRLRVTEEIIELDRAFVKRLAEQRQKRSEVGILAVPITVRFRMTNKRARMAAHIEKGRYRS